MSSTVSIVGRPNVGKSTLFNRLIGRRKAIVHDEYGVTRDRHYGESFWNGKNFSVIDTGGYLPDESDAITSGIREQVHMAIEESDVILFIVDTEMGIHPLDQAVSEVLRKQDKPVLLVVNKCDNEQKRMEAVEFYGLGFDEIYPVSSISGTGTGDLLDKVVELLPDDNGEEEDKLPKIAFVGRPNVGKSSLMNALLKSDRCIVTDIPGTTRDAINSKLEYNGETYIIVDTAGLRKKAKVKENIEFYSTVRTDRSIKEADVVVVMLDAMQGFDEQDKRILREAENFNKGIIIVLNKWDNVPEKNSNLLKEFEEYIHGKVRTMDYIPIISISALTGLRIEKVLDYSKKVIQERKKKIPTPELNDTISKILKERPLPVKRGRQLKIQYAVQVKSNPPVFKFFMNNPQELPPNYRRFLENKIREYYSFKGVPITMVFRQK
ncbi:ribosome biogenesis GTPase Der [Rhodohalobacter sulfatireducens]|uniref:ribosome biogenesis GTPase Der n=1 Tax=Rhodohalobacter sulfatireducens TaxID=2911366 RepID=UPI00272D795F|nr:ribosome biogenesis GTPase Der [Rhodohalobacter sulfatireducens]MDR9364200.1 ribosome biogenesis GTPase Der [Balneolaceae bacterium]MDR9410044.1 ribosome biogenesis GTPase Der [Balneolaceae bacterium]